MTGQPRLLTTGEVAHLFRVDPKTVGTWARIGRLKFIPTPGGHRRFPSDQFAPEVLAVLDTERRPGTVAELEPGSWLWFGNRARQVHKVVFAPPTERTHPDRVAVIYFEDSPVGITGDEGQTIRYAWPSEIPTTHESEGTSNVDA